MGIFNRKNANKKDTPKETNEINNKKLKETLANTAISTLVQGEQYQDLAYTTVTFGYLFMIDGHGVEALFKVITDMGTFYFAVQKQSLIILNFNEALFETTTAGFLDLHS
jgi:deoxyxylulose-5-phosphate synthase